jgi:ADP-heptose:LPS heptosyltransferase
VERLLCYDAGDRSALASLRCRARTKALLTFSAFYERFSQRWIFHQTHFHEQGQKYRARYFWDITPGENADFAPPRLRLPPADWSHLSLPKEPFILLHPTSAWRRKCWSAVRWREVLAHLRNKTHLPIVLTGGVNEWERGLCNEIAGERSDAINLGGRMNLAQIISALAGATFVMTVDGFISHLALAFRKPCVTLFGPTNANHWHLATEWSEAIYEGNNPAAKSKSLEGVPTNRVIESTDRWLERVMRAPIDPPPAPSAGS